MHMICTVRIGLFEAICKMQIASMSAISCGMRISGFFFGDILKFCSPLAYISIHYRRIGRLTSDKDKQKDTFWRDISAQVLSVVTMKRPNQSNKEHNERTVC